MAQVEVTVNGRSYIVACDDGQEGHVTRLGRYLDQKVGTLVKSVGQIGDARLLVMASLLIADELVETDRALSQANDALAKAASAREQARAEALGQAGAATPSPDEAVLARSLGQIAERIEAIAAELEAD